jgi:Ca-activated chloride channel family protein
VEESAVTAWTHWFAQPWALTLLAALPVLSLLFAWARWRRRQALRQLGTPYLVERLLLTRPRRRGWQTLLLMLGLGSLIVGAAGPRWGLEGQPELLGGKDLVTVLDLSKSMLAEQPSRLERARRSLRDLADTLERRGGHRVALVVFAAHPKLVFPLTSDYEHFRFAFETFDAEELPPALRPQAGEKIPSGTRFGDALRLAVEAHDPRRAGRQDIVLLSDGDDPAGDEEWALGVQEAHRRNLPIHVVAIGDPDEAHAIRQGSDVLRHDGVVIQTKLNEPLLQEIARRTGGIYFPAHANSLPLGKLLRGYLDTHSDHLAADPEHDESGLVHAEPHYAWFLLPALILLSASMFLGDGPRDAPTETLRGAEQLVPRDSREAKWRSRTAVVILLPAILSAAPLPSVEDFVRQGNAAFGRQQFDEALQLYARAEERSTDPGLVAFNQAAALFRLGRFDESAVHYQRCLEDQMIPAPRQARANYDLGNALLQAGVQDRRRLEHAIDAYRRSLNAELPDDLRADALHNLELAKWLWLKAKPPSDAAPSTMAEPEKNRLKEPRGNGAALTGAKNGNLTDDGNRNKAGVEQSGLGTQKKLAHGPLQVLPDHDQLTPLTPEETAAHLEQFIERMRRERRSYWQQAGPAPSHVKDW